ncbi:MAG: hypothetical protein K0S61_2681 [Anaerocolumna sp.]|nr:hypothetical protein [Anaerocolumna sp.]
MGKLILCNGKQALKPYGFKTTNTYVYSIEELCYYIYHNVTALASELREEGLISWIEEELELKDSAQKLRQLILSEAGFKDIVVCILLSCDYYGEAQIKELVLTVDEFINLPPIELSVKRAGNYLRYKQYTKALAEFEDIIEDTEYATLNGEMKARILHNMGVALLHNKGPMAALGKFKEAYEEYNNEESLREYFLILLMTKQEEKALSELVIYKRSDDFLTELKDEYAKTLVGMKELSQILTTSELRETKESGKVGRFYQVAYTLIEDLKKNYREENL